MNRIEIKSKLVSDYRIEYECEIYGDWKKYFTNEKFFVEYSIPINKINRSIAIIPILGTVLPISWLFDAEIKVDEIDKMFYESIPEFKKGYEEMYPQLEFLGKLSAIEIVENNQEKNIPAMLFSAGVDAFDTLISHIKEKPALITIWGADISVDNNDGWSVVEKHRDDVVTDWKLNGVTIKSSFKKWIEECILSEYTLKMVNDSWWHGFHHSIGMFALTAPVAFCEGYTKLYVASSFTPADIGNYTCASDPTIDNYVKFCGCSVVHDGYEFNRQDKIHNICKYSQTKNEQIKLRVCWESIGGSNCCHCEKCYRTMLGIFAERMNPEHFGFSEKKWLENVSMIFMPQNFKVSRYKCIQRRMRENYKINEIPKSLNLLYKVDADVILGWMLMKRRIKNIIKYVVKLLRKIFKHKIA